MTYSTIIHSSLVNPAKPVIAKESVIDNTDTVTVDIPLLIRLLELAREDLKSDIDIHNITSNMLDLKNSGTLTMANYDQIVSKEKTNDIELESIKKLAGI